MHVNIFVFWNLSIWSPGKMKYLVSCTSVGDFSWKYGNNATYLLFVDKIKNQLLELIIE